MIDGTGGAGSEFLCWVISRKADFFFFLARLQDLLSFSVLQIIGKPFFFFFFYISSGLVKARNGAESNSCGRLCFHVILGDLTTCVLNLCRKVRPCTFWNRWDVYFQMSRQQVRFPDYGRSDEVKIFKCASMSLTTLIITCLGHFILYGEEKSPDIEMIFFLSSLEACALHFPWSVSPQPPVSWPLLTAHILWDWPIWPALENRTLTDTSSFKRLAFLIPRGQFCQRKAFQPSTDEGGVVRVCVCVCRGCMFFMSRRMSPSLLLLSVFTFVLHLMFMPRPPLSVSFLPLTKTFLRKPYQQCDVWVFWLLIDSIYLYTLLL